MTERRRAGLDCAAAPPRPLCGTARLAAAACLACIAVVSLCPSGGRAGTPIPLIEKEFLLQPKELTLPAGEIAFLVKNQGAIEHNLVLDGPGGKTVARLDSIEPGQDRRFAAKLAPGVYILYCSLPGHREAGMAGTVRVTAAASPPVPVPVPFFHEREGGGSGGGESP